MHFVITIFTIRIIHETLQELGVSPRETDIYLALLRLGPSSIRDIAAAAKINRGITYAVLKVRKHKVKHGLECNFRSGFSAVN
jgi:DNA-binding MarR family transcriptional regulator